jgi:hypothetical protein
MILPPYEKHASSPERIEQDIKETSGMDQRLVKEIVRLRKELLEVEEARHCAIRTIEYLESLHQDNQERRNPFTSYS